jgi:hypothetical protein
MSIEKRPYTVGWEFISAANRLVEHVDQEAPATDFEDRKAVGEDVSRHISLSLEIVRTGVAAALEPEVFAESHAEAVRAGKALLDDRLLFEM